MTNIFAQVISAGSTIDLDDRLDDPLDTRQGVDPILSAVEHDLTSAADLSSVGQVGAASDVSAGQIGVTGDYRVIVAGAAADSLVELDVATRGELERPL